MAKKSFKENPALSFISQALADNPPPQERQPQEPPADDANKHTHTSTDIDTPMYTAASYDTNAPDATPAAIKAAFGSQAPAARSRPAQDGSGITARSESKSKRLQLLIRPSTYQGISVLAKDYHTSVNDIINQILEEYLRRG